jgi:hypothetical protein
MQIRQSGGLGRVRADQVSLTLVGLFGSGQVGSGRVRTGFRSGKFLPSVVVEQRGQWGEFFYCSY